MSTPRKNAVDRAEVVRLWRSGEYSSLDAIAVAVGCCRQSVSDILRDDAGRVPKQPQASKPCACGRPSCLVLRGKSERYMDFRKRRFACRSDDREQLRKPCECGDPGCFVVQREDEKIYDFRARRFGTRRCANTYAALKGQQKGEHGGLCAPVSWLDQPSGRIIAQRQAQGIRLP